MPVFKIHHVTKYNYVYPVKESCNEIKIYPSIGDEQTVLQHEVVITNNPDVQLYTDYWGNVSGFFSVVPPHSEIVIESKLTVKTIAAHANPLASGSTLASVVAAKKGNIMLIETATPDVIDNQEQILAIIDALEIANKSVAQIADACNSYIFKNFKYTKGITNVETTVDEILQSKAGVCQDFAHVMLQILRTVGLPCRYVSGYICPNKNGMRGEGATHAWVEVFIPEIGWAGIDPTNNVWATDNHVKLAVGRHFVDCTPLKGVFKGVAKQQLSVYVAVGYEDGQVFEEVNKVNLEFVASTGKQQVVAVIDYTNDQQQQQQQ